MANVREINRIEELEDYRAAWRGLLDATPRASFFQSLEWLEAYWRHYGKHQKLRVLLAIGDDGALVGILPLVVRWETTRLGRLRYLTYPLDYWGSFYGPIGGEPRAILDAGLSHVARARRDWDAIELRWTGVDEFDPSDAPATLKAHGLHSCRTMIDRTALIRLEDTTWEEYLVSRGTKWRNNFRRWERRAADLGEITHLRYRPQGEAHGDGEPRWDLYEACLSLAERSWQGSSQTGTTLSHSSVRDFLRDAHAAAARAGGLDLNLLLAGGQPVAFAYNYCQRGYVFGLRIGYDEQNSKLALGNILYARVFEDSFRRGDSIYDMGPNHIEAKQSLLTEVHPIFRYSHFCGRSLRGQLVRLKRLWDSQDVAPSTSTAAVEA